MQRFLNKKILVTGGLGFIGSHLVDKLVDEGANVVIIDNLYSGYIENKNKDAKWYDADFTDLKTVEYIMSKEKPEYVFHIGAWGRMPMCMENPIGAYQNNLMGTINILQASREFGVKKVILSSSCIVYCQHTPYWATKVALEDAAKVYREMYGLSTISLRYGNVYGTRQKVGMDSAMFAMLKDSYEKEGKVKIFGDGEQTRDWVNVSDVCEANMLSALSNYEGELDIATGKTQSLNYIVKEVLKIPFEHTEERKGDEKHIKLNPELAKTAIGFEAKVVFEEGIKEIWN